MFYLSFLVSLNHFMLLYAQLIFQLLGSKQFSAKCCCAILNPNGNQISELKERRKMTLTLKWKEMLKPRAHRKELHLYNNNYFYYNRKDS